MITQRAQQVLFDRAGRLVLAVTLLVLMALAGCSSPPAATPAAPEAGQPAAAIDDVSPDTSVAEKATLRGVDPELEAVAAGNVK